LTPYTVWDFRLDCGWHGQFRHHHFIDQTFVNWFDLWAGVEHRVNGALYNC
jgi:hypothetical protein